MRSARGVAGVLLLCAAAGGLSLGSVAQAPASAPVRVSCVVRRAPLSDAEAALAREDYAGALAGFAAMEASAPDRSRQGRVRVLIEQNKVEEASEIAAAWLKQQPASGSALETMAEVWLREGRLADAYHVDLAALQADPCNARAHQTLGRLEDLSANFASSAEQAGVAHRLDPRDPEIRRAWIATLPPAERRAELLALSQDGRITSPDGRRRLLTGLQFAASHSMDSCRIASAVDHATVPIEPILDGPARVTGLALRVQINGKMRLLELDSGAHGLLLSRGAARSLGLVRDVQTETGGLGDSGRVTSSIASVASVRVGELEFTNCPVDILEKSSALNIDGLVGADLFARFEVTIDYPARQLRLSPLPRRPEEAAAGAGPAASAGPAAGAGGHEAGRAGDNPAADKAGELQPGSAAEPAKRHDRYIAPEMKDWTRIYREGHDLLLPVSIGEASDRLFIVDTGSSSMLISPAAARAVTKVRGDDSVRIRGLSGEVKKVYSTSGFVLRFAHLVQKVDSMTSVDTTGVSHNLGIEVAGFLGAPVLELLTIHIDYRDDLIQFDYKRR